MSVRYMMSRVGARAAQAARDAVGRSAGKADRAQQQSMARAGRAPAESARAKAPLARKAAKERRRRAAQEESLRTVMFLSMWGPNA
ncbi:hypothetical protein CFC21_026195 [Triticum aestivum]|uniref:Small EDRK-rich factor-like N-terminal domain-containing protein n=2 Tax=Triticum aestivum TaxID=4565 RepID=A0A9R1JCE5_WHEAT|nr:uncharacterized protein LOC123042550 [Triticum aestivum]KAF7011949.1 hypothetical protein CFC21_026195 [Triticum aestivum]